MRFSIKNVFLLIALVALGLGWYLEKQKNQIPRPKYTPGQVVSNEFNFPVRIVRATYWDYGGKYDETWLYEVRTVGHLVPSGGMIEGNEVTPYYLAESQIHSDSKNKGGE